MEIPKHLQKYVVEQNYSRYTPVDQAVWRYILRQLRDFLAVHAHPCYLDGLEKTGISIDRIPRIEEISEKISEFGWRAMPVSGFIPPAAFMEMQSLGILPIASDMRSLDHLLYTPAPDIVHEAAGHAPILVDPDFADYLKRYAQVAKKALISSEDLAVYEAIRELSDIKENPHSSAEEIARAEKRLDQVNAAVSHVSEAALLGRMNWWTAEYGLIGSLDQPKIFGAGLLSSVGEARACLSDKVKKIPLTVECIEYGYDITEPQPQLFVTPDFARLTEVLEDLADRMAFRQGGAPALEKALKAKTVNTLELDSGLQISGRVEEWNPGEGKNEVGSVRLSGPCQFSLAGGEIPGKGAQNLPDQLLCLFGPLQDGSHPQGQKLSQGLQLDWQFQSGFQVQGQVRRITYNQTGKPLFVELFQALVHQGDKVLHRSEDGPFDLILASQVRSVYAGPGDREAFGETQDFVAARVPAPQWSTEQKKRHQFYQEIRNLRDQLARLGSDERKQKINTLLDRHKAAYRQEWLPLLELLEICIQSGDTTFIPPLESALEDIAFHQPEKKAVIEDGLRLSRVV